MRGGASPTVVGMGGQVLGGGVIVLVAVLLWLVYLLPSWHSRRVYDSAERNAVRLNQALRILAETSETPEQVRIELNARTVLRQQRLAKQATAAREHAELQTARADLESARAERLAAQEDLRVRRRAAHDAPAARRSRARRRARLVATVLVLASLAVAGYGGWQVLLRHSWAQPALWAGVAGVGVGVLVLHRMSRVAARAAVAAQAPASVAVVQAPGLPTDLLDDRGWTPRGLPRPLSASTGSAAASVLDAAEAGQAVRDAARDEQLRRRAAQLRPAPPDIAAARAAHPEPAAANASAFAAMGYVDDAEIEAHVRGLLRSRAAG